MNNLFDALKQHDMGLLVTIDEIDPRQEELIFFRRPPALCSGKTGRAPREFVTSGSRLNAVTSPGGTFEGPRHRMLGCR